MSDYFGIDKPSLVRSAMSSILKTVTVNDKVKCPQNNSLDKDKDGIHCSSVDYICFPARIMMGDPHATEKSSFDNVAVTRAHAVYLPLVTPTGMNI